MAFDLDSLHLAYGGHDERDDGVCLLEAVAWFAGEEHSDHPECVCPVLGAFGRAWNDALPGEDRDRLLKPFIPLLVGTRSTADVQDTRALLATDWAVRTFTPAWLRKAELDERADELANLPELSTVELCLAAMPVIDEARKQADAAGEAAGEAAWEAAWEAARAAAWEAAWAAAREAAGEAARAAAREALRSTVVELQASAVDLFDRMIKLGPVA